MGHIVDGGYVKCVNQDTHKKYDFLKQFAIGKNTWCKSGELHVSQGRPYDGAIVIEDNKNDKKGHIFTDDGKLYKNLTRLERERFKRRILAKQPDQYVSADLAKRFIAEVFGDAELSKRGRKKFCSDHPELCKDEPESLSYASARGKYNFAMKEFKKLIAASTGSKTFGQALKKLNSMLGVANSKSCLSFFSSLWLGHLRSLSLVIAQAEDASFRKKHIKQAVVYAKLALAANDKIDSDMDILWKTRSYHIVLARVYAADGQYKKALRQIPQFMRGIGKNIELWKMPSIQALRERFAWEYILSGKALLDVAAFMFDSAASLLSFGAEGNYQK